MARPSAKVRSISSRIAPRVSPCFEVLERRALLSSASINYSDFSSTAGLTANGFGSTPPSSSNQLVMTDSQNDEARSVFYNTPVPFDRFTTHFSYRADPTGSPADGFAFALQENGPTALGAIGGSLGYQSMGGQHVGVGFDVFHNFYYLFNGDTNIARGSGHFPVVQIPFSLTNGDTYAVTISYDGTTLTTTIADQTNPGSPFTNAIAIDLHAALGANTAYAGFTGATGGLVSTQHILNWDYAGNDGLAITTPAAATPGAVTAKSTALSVTATDVTNGGALTYAWSIVHKPSGAADPTFDDNSSAAADNTTAHFFKDGTYILKATATNTNGLTDSSNVKIVVSQTATAVRVSPHAQKIARGGKQTCTAIVTDQFGHPMRTQPAIAWSLVRSAGSIDASTGLFTAGKTKGHVSIQASDTLDDLLGTIGATVA